MPLLRAALRDAGCVACLLAITACSSAPPPAPPTPPPALEVAFDHRPGRALSGVLDSTGEAQLPESRADGGRPLHVTVVRLEEHTADWQELTLALPSAAIVADPRQARPLRSSAVLLREMRFRAGPPPADATVLGEADLLLVPGAAAECVVRGADPDGIDAAAPELARWAFSPGPDGTVRIGLDMMGVAVAVPPGIDTLRDDDGVRPPEPIAEVAAWQRTLPAAGFTMLCPSPFSGDPTVLGVHVADAQLEDAARIALVASVSEQIERRRAAAVEARSIPDAMRLLQLSGSDAVESTRYRAHVRHALAQLSILGDAPVAADLALAAHLDWLVLWSRRFREAVADEKPRGRVALSWILERTAFEQIAETAMERGLDTVLDAVAVRHMGEPGRDPALILNLLASCGERALLEQRLRSENRFALDASEPAARIRAFDWLARRGLAPADYDPLGSREARREALHADRLARQQAAAQRAATEDNDESAPDRRSSGGAR